jgi:hypothetical protein
MLSALAVSGYIIPTPPLGINEDFNPTRSERSILVKLAKIAEVVAHARFSLTEQSERFEALFDEAAKLTGGPDELEALAEAVLQKEREAAAKVMPGVEHLRHNLSQLKSDAPTAHSWRRWSEEAIEIAVSRLELYQNLRIRLLKLASDRQSVNEPGSPVFSDAASATEYLRKLIGK